MDSDKILRTFAVVVILIWKIETSVDCVIDRQILSFHDLLVSGSSDSNMDDIVEKNILV